MSHPDIDYMIVMERRRDELADAENYRLFHQALKVRKENELSGRQTVRLSGFHPQWTARMLILALARSLSFFGDRMITWSCRLQVRYQAMSGAGTSSGPCR